MNNYIREAIASDVPDIVSLPGKMQEEIQEIEFSAAAANTSIEASIRENVHWFLFLDENGKKFGTCYLQSVHNYWRLGKRYYLGGFYVHPSHRGQGRFKELYNLLKAWVKGRGGVQIYAHISKNNLKSIQAFASVGCKEDPDLAGNMLCIDHWG